MTQAQRITVRLSECRQRLNELLGMEERNDEQQTELAKLTSEVQKLEPELRAAIAAEGVEQRDAEIQLGSVRTPEERERDDLHGRARLGSYLLAAMQGREPSGAEHEFRSALGIRAGIPLALFEPTFEERATALRRREFRADAATTIPATGTGTTVAPIQPAIFARSIAPMLGIDMPAVGSGAYSTLTVTTALTAAVKAKGGAQESTAATLTAATASPRRITGRLSLQIEDIAAVGSDTYEAALRANLQDVMGDAYDGQCINGNGAAPNVEGLIKQLTDPANPATVAGFDDFVAAFADRIDGLWAAQMRDVAIITNPDTYKLAAKKFRDRVIDTGQRGGVSLGDVSFADYALTHTGGFSCNKRMPATAANIATGIAHLRGRPGVVTAQHPVWDAITVDDIYSDAASGQKHVTMHLLVGDKVLLVQKAAYSRVEFKVS